MILKSLRLTSLGVIALSICAASPLSADTVRLSSLDLGQMTTGWSVATADRGIAGQPLSIAKKRFDHGVGTHAVSNFRVNVGRNSLSFTAQVGVDDSAGAEGSVEFIVSGDGKTLWKSGVMTRGQAARPVAVDLAGVNTLGLRVTDGGDGASSDHADWADAKIIMNDGAAKPLALPPHEQFSAQTKSFALSFEVGDDGRLYQQPVGAPEANKKLQRNDESYPQAGDGYIWEPALQVVHADGNTSTSLTFEEIKRTNNGVGRELIQVKLHDPAYPLEVTLNIQTDRERDVVEQWTEIVHHESGAVTLERMASTALLLPSTNLHLTHFCGDWGKEMLVPITEPITPGMKVLDSKIGVRADQFQIPSFVLSLDGPPAENGGRVLVGSLEWTGSFQLAFDDNGQKVRALCGINPFASAYH